MRLALLLGLLAGLVSGQKRNIFDLIPPDARMVYGSHVARYEQSVLHNFYPNGLDGFYGGQEWRQHVRQMIITECMRGGLTIVTGEVGPLFAGEQPEEGRPGYTVLGPGTAIIGDADSLNEAAARWQREDLSGIAVKAERLAATYDNWFIAVRPLAERDRLSDRAPGPRLKYMDDMAGLVEEVRGGLCVGRRSEFHLEVDMKTTEDAQTLAALGRWLPGFVQSKNPHGRAALIAEYAENISITPSGNTVTLSFTLEEGKLEEVLRREEELPAQHEGFVE